MKKNSPYIKCPRCELNYIPKDESLCDVCKAELKLIQSDSLLSEDEDEILCPICKQNYISIDEDMCLKCAERLGERENTVSRHEETEEWDYIDEAKEADDLDIVSLSDIEEEEKSGMFDEEEEGEEDFAEEEFDDDLFDEGEESEDDDFEDDEEDDEDDEENED